MEIRDRIRLIMEKENMLSGAFADSIGIKQSTFSHLLNGRNNPSLDIIMKIHRKYNYINIEWLLYGIGNMISKNSTDQLFTSDVNIHPSLFDQNNTEPQETIVEHPIRAIIQEPTSPEIRYIEKPLKKITEIKIFFDDNTYETFKNEK